MHGCREHQHSACGWGMRPVSCRVGAPSWPSAAGPLGQAFRDELRKGAGLRSHGHMGLLRLPGGLALGPMRGTGTCSASQARIPPRSAPDLGALGCGRLW